MQCETSLSLSKFASGLIRSSGWLSHHCHTAASFDHLVMRFKTKALEIEDWMHIYRARCKQYRIR
ncbi:hypothetical protein BGY98DRAFT_1055201 [Russula aff. rugulosa BPL654]|nr:hypothetical protein BGY98DRAFT_1055201 [Russula aff. rugulosa BPL654]